MINKRLPFKLNIQLFGELPTPEAVIAFLKAEGNTNFLSENGFQTTVEVEKNVEVEKPYTDEGVKAHIEGNQGLRDSLHNASVSKYLKKQLGVEEVTPEMLGKPIVLAETIEDHKKAAVATLLSKVKYGDLLGTKLDYSKISFGDGKIEGLEEQMGTLKEKYPDLFSTEPGAQITPPGVPDNKEQKIKNLEAELADLEAKAKKGNREARILARNKREEIKKEKGE